MSKYTVIENYTTDTYTLLRLDPHGQEGMAFEPGQYLTIATGNASLTTPVRCFSIVSALPNNILEVAFRPTGGSTETFSQLQPGHEVSVQGPYGDFILPEPMRPAALLSSGIGITPFISMIRNIDATDSQRRVALLASTKTVDALPMVDELRAIAARRHNVTVDIFSGGNEPDTLHDRIQPELIRRLVGAMPESTVYYVCGPDEFSGRMIRALREAGVDERDIRTESFTQQAKTASGKRSVKQVVWGSIAGATALAGVITAGALVSANTSSVATTTTSSSSSSTPTATTSTTATPTTSTSTTATTSSSTTQSYTAPTTIATTSASSSAS